ncbi:MAG: nodulation protein NfeD [Parvibaculum sp.]
MTLRWRFIPFALTALVGAALAGAMPGETRAAAPDGTAAEAAAEAAPLVLVATVKGAIGPATAKQIADAIAAAEEREAAALVIRLDTPGGLVSSTRDIVSSLLASEVPVAGYVWPPGGHAASAGTYIIYATGVAAMAPGTNIGAATPVTMGGGGMPGGEAPKEGEEKSTPSNDEALAKKATNDAVALIVSLAETHGRNAAWAEEAVRDGASIGARAAKETGVVEIIAADLDDLLAQMDGREALTAAGTATLATKGATVEHVEPGFMVQLLAVISNPNVAFILMLVGVYGLIFEMSNPGSIGPGVLGAISLLLGLYALNELPLDYTGLALILLGLGLMAAEAFTPAFGALGAGGVISFVFGAAILVDSDSPEFQLSWWTIGSTAAASVVLILVIIGYALAAMRRPVVTGAEEMTGAEARVLEWADGEGWVHLHGERWHARGPQDLGAQAMVRVEKIDGLTLVVR